MRLKDIKKNNRINVISAILKHDALSRTRPIFLPARCLAW